LLGAVAEPTVVGEVDEKIQIVLRVVTCDAGNVSQSKSIIEVLAERLPQRMHNGTILFVWLNESSVIPVIREHPGFFTRRRRRRWV